MIIPYDDRPLTGVCLDDPATSEAALRVLKTPTTPQLFIWRVSPRAFGKYLGWFRWQSKRQRRSRAARLRRALYINAQRLRRSR